MVVTGPFGAYEDQALLMELSILEKPMYQTVSGSIYTADDVEDETLEQIMRPNKGVAATMVKKRQQLGGIATIYDTVYPNCLAFNDQGRLYVGDSSGVISFWDVTMKGN